MTGEQRAIAIVGAGPAGLLLATSVALLLEREARGPAVHLVLLDKRQTYERTHRLRMAPKPYKELQKTLGDPRFDALVAFLEGERWSPRISDLEQHLLTLTQSLGVAKRVMHVGEGPGKIDFAALRQGLEDDGLLSPGAPFVVVAADSVRSETKQLAGFSNSSAGRTYYAVARVLLSGADLPTKLNVVDQLKLSKLLGSIVDYRLRKDGVAEVDLFLDDKERQALLQLNASPRSPVVIDDVKVQCRGAPLFRRVVAHLQMGFAPTPCEVQLASLFELEHNVEPTLTRRLDDVNAWLFLVGDAGISLPFFRGMACLAKCVRQLALLVVPEMTQDAPALDACAARYESACATIKDEEVSIVNARGRLIRVAREFVRISAMSPLPMQDWLLSIPVDSDARLRPCPAFWLSFAFALPVLLLVAAGNVGELVLPLPGLSWLALLVALPIQVGGGVLYHYVADHLPKSLPLVRTLWRVQVLLLLIGGVGVSTATVVHAGSSAQIAAALSWFVLGLALVLGLVVFEKASGAWSK